MTIEEAKKLAADIFPYPVELEKTAKGSCRITRELKEGEEHATVLNDGKRVLLASAQSWRSALQYAAKPVLEERQKAENVKREARQQEDRLARVDANKFSEFLIEKFGAEFEAYKNRGEDAEAASPAAPPNP